MKNIMVIHSFHIHFTYIFISASQLISPPVQRKKKDKKLRQLNNGFADFEATSAVLVGMVKEANSL